MRTLVFTVADKKIKGQAEKIKDVLWVHLDGETFCYKPERLEKGKKAHSSKQSGLITAPMPGKITKINAAPNSEVKEGQVLIIMEAMKMEYSLKADKSGKIKFLGCKANDQVTLGQKLIEIE